MCDALVKGGETYNTVTNAIWYNKYIWNKALQEITPNNNIVK
jgi:hypothetical protein